MAFQMSRCTQASGYSPYYLLFGREMRIFVDTAVSPSDSLPKSHKQHVEELLLRLQTAHEIAKSNIDKSKEQNKARYDVAAKEPSKAVGDKVYLKLMHRSQGVSKKLTPRLAGRYYIIRLGPNSTFKLRRCSENIELKPLVHADRLKKYVDDRDYRPPPAHGPATRPHRDIPNRATDIDEHPDLENIVPPIVRTDSGDSDISNDKNDATVKNK